MGSRGAFIDVDRNNFDFKNGTPYFKTINKIDDVVVIKKDGHFPVPEFSHSPSRKYAIVERDILKYIAFYDENHKQRKVIDLDHFHKGLKPHIHYDMKHDDDGIPTTEEDNELIGKIRKDGKYE